MSAYGSLRNRWEPQAALAVARKKLKINGQKYPANLVRGKASKYTEYRP